MIKLNWKVAAKTVGDDFRDTLDSHSEETFLQAMKNEFGRAAKIFYMPVYFPVLFTASLFKKPPSPTPTINA